MSDFSFGILRRSPFQPIYIAKTPFVILAQNQKEEEAKFAPQQCGTQAGKSDYLLSFFLCLLLLLSSFFPFMLPAVSSPFPRLKASCSRGASPPPSSPPPTAAARLPSAAETAPSTAECGRISGFNWNMWKMKNNSRLCHRPSLLWDERKRLARLRDSGSGDDNLLCAQNRRAHLLLRVDLSHARLALVLGVAVRPVHEPLVFGRRLHRRRDHRVNGVLRHEVPAVPQRRRHVVRHLRHRRVVRLAPGRRFPCA